MGEENIFSIESVEGLINEFSEAADARAAFVYAKKLATYLEAERLKTNNPDLYYRYERCLAKLKFIALNFLDDWAEIDELVKENFSVVYDLKYFDFWDKLKVNLVAVGDLAERDKIKDGLKQALLTSASIMIDRRKYDNIQTLPITAADWLKDYHVNVGSGQVENLKRAQYLTDGENIKKLREEDKDKVKNLIDVYEKLKTSSSTRAGFEDDVPMVIEGKPIMFSGGEAVEISKDLLDLIRSITNGDETIVKTIDRPIKEIDAETQKKLQQLKDIAEQFPPGSLERRAVEEEMKKLGN